MRSLACLLLCAPLVLADNYPRQPGIDAQHYILRVTLSDDTDEIIGEATVALRFVKDGVKEFALDLTSLKEGKGMAVTEVTADGGALQYSHATDRLLVTLPASPKAGETRRYTVKYHGVPGYGLKIVKNKFGERCFFSVN